MVQLLGISADRIVLRNPDGTVRLDTDEKMLHLVGATISGSQSIPAVGGSGGSTPNISQTNDYTIATGRNAACTHVVGAVKFTGSGSWGAAFSRWTTYAGGSLMWGLDNPGAASAADGAMAMIFTFFMSGTDVIMRQEVRIDDAGVAYGFNAFDIAWELDTGIWT